ncbi:MAG: hypothetical protein QOE60_428 [Thermoleophilaceae bacterium]|jgi:hypothetical protein|nr:hypothetical protein [Thermoleophilaceae bacterium]
MPLRVRMQVLRGFVKALVTYPWWGLRLRLQRARFDPNARHVIVVEPGPDGRPGERLVTPSPRAWKTRMVLGVRKDFHLHLDTAGSHLTGVCLGRVAERGDPAASARKTIAHCWAKGHVTLTPITVERVGGEEAYRYRLGIRGMELTEWKFAHDGWLYVVGALCRSKDATSVVSRARATLDTWEWLG